MTIKEYKTAMWKAAQYRDLQGIFYITTTWKKHGDNWKVIFNMDSRIMG